MTTAQLLAGDPIWLIIIKVVAIFALLMLLTLLMIWFERRVVGRMQHRPGPNWNGPFGLLQSLADGLKFPFKEDIRPVLADKWVYILAPIVSAIPAFTAFAVIPLGGQVSLFGHQTALQLTDLPVGVLVVLACSSMGVYGIVLAGWSSGSPYPLLGALRSAAQVISYEIAMGLSIVAVVLYSGSLSTGDIVAAQAHGWYFYMLPVSFVIYLISMVGETNRAPFDLAEAESELVGGFHTEYSSFKFALFFLAEYINMITVSALATTMFLGGWHGPWLAGTEFDTGWWPVLWFFGKTVVLLFGFVWLRGTLPRFRYDQFMQLGWKVLVPVSLVWIVAISALRTVHDTKQLFIGLGVALVALVVLALLIPDRPLPVDEMPMAGSDYPVPPLDLEIPRTPKRRPGRHREPAAPAGETRTAVTAGVSGAANGHGAANSHGGGAEQSAGAPAATETSDREASDGIL